MLSVALTAGFFVTSLTPISVASQTGPIEDTLQVSPQFWNPVGVSMMLDSPAVSSVLRSFRTVKDSVDNNPWKYDITQFRLFRWMQDRWLEYSDVRSDSFSFVPGRVMWLKTSESLSRIFLFYPGGGTALSTADTIIIAPHGWADICNPDRVNVRLSDIFAATARGNSHDSLNDSLFLFHWQDSVSQTGSLQFFADPIYLPAVPATSDIDTSLGYRIEYSGAYSIYNACNAFTVALIIPAPVADTAGTSKALSKVQPGAGWTIKVNSSTPKGTISPVYCAWSATGTGTRYFPAPSRWGDVSAGVYDPASNAVFGSALIHASGSSGQTFELVFQNSGSNDAVVTYSAAPVVGIGSMTVSLIDPAGGGARQVSGLDKITVTVPGKSKIYRYLAVGTAGFAGNVAKTVSQVDFSLKVTPNPVRGIAVIEYLVPYNSIQKVRCEVVDFQGRTIWAAVAGSTLHPGLNTMQWNAGSKKPPAGAYIIRITGFDGYGVARAEKISKITYLP